MNRKTIRKEISIELQEPFFKDMLEGFATKVGGTTPIPLTLWNQENKLVGAWIHFLTGANAGVTRRIKSYNPVTGAIQTDPALPSTWATDDTFEIHARFSPIQKNQAIDKAVREAYPLFYALTRHNITIDGERVEYDLEDLEIVGEEITRAWWLADVDNPQPIKVTDILPLSSGAFVTSIVLPQWLVGREDDVLRIEVLNRPTVPTTDASDVIDVAVEFVKYRAMMHLLMSGGAGGPERDWQDEKWRGQFYMSEAERIKRDNKIGNPLRTRWRVNQRPPARRIHPLG